MTRLKPRWLALAVVLAFIPPHNSFAGPRFDALKTENLTSKLPDVSFPRIPNYDFTSSSLHVFLYEPQILVRNLNPAAENLLVTTMSTPAAATSKRGSTGDQSATAPRVNRTPITSK